MGFQITEVGSFYNNYKGKKCSKACFYKRVSRNGMSLEEAIKPGHITKQKNKIGTDGRWCKKCNKRKTFYHFTKGKSYCKDCCNELNKIYQDNNRDMIHIRRKNKRDSDSLSKLRDRLNAIFYSDPNIKKIISLEPKDRRIKRAFKGDILKDKFFYFLNRGYDKEQLINLFGNHNMYDSERN